VVVAEHALTQSVRKEEYTHFCLPLSLLSAAIKVSSDRCDQNRTEQMRCERTLWCRVDVHPV
jgi:hypothetical protein